MQWFYASLFRRVIDVSQQKKIPNLEIRLLAEGRWLVMLRIVIV